jgi:hypothetical protein
MGFLFAFGGGKKQTKAKPVGGFFISPSPPLLGGSMIVVRVAVGR